MERTDPDFSREVRSHEIRVARIGAAIGREIGMFPHQVRAIFLSGRFHDVGKLQVARTVLFKAGSLDEAERAQVEAHVDLGVEIISRGDLHVPRYLLDGMRHHHERYDGFGYNGLRGEAIPYVARVICIADVYDALRADRSYKTGMDEGQALAMMCRQDREFGRFAFDPFLLRAFVGMRLRTVPGSLDPVAATELDAFARSDPMSDLGDDALVTISRTGHRVAWCRDGEARMQVALIYPDGSMVVRRHRQGEVERLGLKASFEDPGLELCGQRIVDRRSSQQGNYVDKNNRLGDKGLPDRRAQRWPTTW